MCSKRQVWRRSTTAPLVPAWTTSRSRALCPVCRWGINQIKIQRSLTTSNVAVFVPFVTQELFQSGAAMYYGINAKSH